MAGDHKCPVCNATFTRPQHVARHMRSHTGDRPYKCQHCGDQFARSDLLSRHVNKCHAAEKPATTTAPNRRKGSASASRATTSKQACDQCVVTNLPCDGSNPCSKCISRKCRCTYVKFHRQTAPVGPGHPAPSLPGERPQHSHFSMEAIMPSEEYLLSHPQNAAAALPGIGGVGSYHPNTMPSSDFTFPVPMYSRSSSLPAAAGNQQNPQSNPDQSSPDFATRYRAQAELLSRAGILHSQIDVPNSVQPSSHSHPPSGMVGASISNTQQQLYNPDQRYASWANGRQDPMDGVVFQSPRSNSQAGYPGSLPSSFSSSTASDPYDLRYGGRESMDDLSDSTSERGHSEQGHSSSDHSFYDSPSISQSVPHHLMVSGQKPGHEHHEGFSSAFGLMSLDDPNVLAGIASDGTPFFTNINVNGESGPTLPVPHQNREDMISGMGLKPLSTKLEGSHEQNGSNGSGPTPREAELRELKDFWKQYMRTPLTGPSQAGSANGFPLATPTPNNVHGHGQLETPTNRPSPSRRLSRVASLSNVKTPPVHSDTGPMGQPPTNSNHHYHNAAPNEGGRGESHNGGPPQRANTYVDSQMGSDDLTSYEQAVLARKTPTLNLVPRKRHGTTGGDVSNGGRFSNPSTTSSSPVVPSVPLGGASRNPSSMDSGPYSRPSSAESTGSDNDGGSRPAFKRLPSTTLEPANSKRTLLSVTGEEWSSSGDGLGSQPTRSGINPDCSRGSRILKGPSSAIMNIAQERHRRMSVPMVAHSLK